MNSLLKKIGKYTAIFSSQHAFQRDRFLSITVIHALSQPCRYAIKGQKTMSELASEYGVHSNQIGRWKKQLLVSAPDVFTRGKDKEAEKKEVERDCLYNKVGQLQIEVDWLKKRQVIWDERR